MNKKKVFGFFLHELWYSAHFAHKVSKCFTLTHQTK